MNLHVPPRICAVIWPSTMQVTNLRKATRIPTLYIQFHHTCAMAFAFARALASRSRIAPGARECEKALIFSSFLRTFLPPCPCSSLNIFEFSEMRSGAFVDADSSHPIRPVCAYSERLGAIRVARATGEFGVRVVAAARGIEMAVPRF